MTMGPVWKLVSIPEIVDAKLLQPGDIGLVDLVERHIALGGERAVVARPVGDLGASAARDGESAKTAAPASTTGAKIEACNRRCFNIDSSLATGVLIAPRRC